MQSALWGTWGIMTYFLQSSDLFVLQDVSKRFVKFIEDKKQLYPLCFISWYVSAYWPYLLFHHPQHHSISFTMTLCCCPLPWHWLHASHLSVDDCAALCHWHCYCLECGIVSPSKDPFLPWWKQQLHPQQQAAAPVDFCLSWKILESCSCCLCFFLPHFAMPRPACTAATSKKSLWQSLLLLHFLTSKHGEVASLEGVFFAHAGQQRSHIDFCPFCSKLYLSHPTISHWIWSTPLLQICEVMAEEVEKKSNPQICTFAWAGTYFDLFVSS